jgi:maleate isomerase
MGDRLRRRTRLGFIVPGANSCAEDDFRAMAPAGVSTLVTRFPTAAIGVADDDVATAVAAGRLLAEAAPDMIVFHCTSGSVAGGGGARSTIAAEIERSTGVCTSATTESVVAALGALGASSVALVTPYPDELNHHLAAFLTAAGFDVAACAGLGIGDPEALAAVSPTEWLTFALDCVPGSRADAVFIPCANVTAAAAIDDVETQLGVPVVTANQCVLWYALRSTRVTSGVDGFGRLLADLQGDS